MKRHGPPVSRSRDGRDYPSTRALDILNERFARGEINKDADQSCRLARLVPCCLARPHRWTASGD
jgi:hypothetical protein